MNTAIDRRQAQSLANKQVSLVEKRKHFMTKLRDDIREAEQKIKRNEKTNENLHASASAGKDMAFISNQISKNEEASASLLEMISTIKKKLEIVMSGECDREIEKLYKSEAQRLAEANEILAKQAAIIADRESRLVADSFGKREYKDVKNEKYLEKSIGREYERFLDVTDSLPDYISRNLDSMPNNKGYRWRGVLFFGKLPEVPNEPVMIFDKKPEGMMITEISNTAHVVYLKTRDGNKKVLSQHRRRLNRRAPATVSQV